MVDWNNHFKYWPKDAPMCVHAEGRTTAAAILLAGKILYHLLPVKRNNIGMFMNAL